MIALGVGVGVDYGIYIYESMQHEMQGRALALREAFYEAMRQRGTAAVFTAVTMSIGVGTWAFSALKFQASAPMGILLAFMFLVNALGAIFLLPALACWLGVGQAYSRSSHTGQRACARLGREARQEVRVSAFYLARTMPMPCASSAASADSFDASCCRCVARPIGAPWRQVTRLKAAGVCTRRSLPQRCSACPPPSVAAAAFAPIAPSRRMRPCAPRGAAMIARFCWPRRLESSHAYLPR